MEQIPFEQLSVSGMTLVALVWIVRAFISNNKEISQSFKNTIDNHITHDTEAKVELKDAVDKNTEVITRLLEKL